MNMSDVERTIVGAARRVCPGFTAIGPARLTPTSALLPGSVGTTRVLAKRPIDLRPFWIERCRHEIGVYEAMRNDPPPVTTPTLVGADPHEPLVIITLTPGRPLHPDRYPAGPVPGTTLAVMLHTLDRLHTWIPRGIPRDDDYPAQLAALRHPWVRQRQQMLLDVHLRTNAPIQVEHGDAHLGNAVTDGAGDITLIDFEFTAWRPAGYDLAKLWVFLPVENNRRQILGHLGRAGQAQAAFWVAVVLVLAREIASYQRDPTQPGGVTLALRLHSDLNVALQHVKTSHQ